MGHLLCYLQLQAALVSCPANFASTDRQKPGHSSSSGALGPVRAGTGAGARGNVVGSPLSSRAALPRRGGTGHGRLGARGLGPEPSCGDGAGETCRWLRESFLLPELLPLCCCRASAAFSSPWSLRGWAATGQPVCYRGKRCSPCRRETLRPWAERKAFA